MFRKTKRNQGLQSPITTISLMSGSEPEQSKTTSDVFLYEQRVCDSCLSIAIDSPLSPSHPLHCLAKTIIGAVIKKPSPTRYGDFPFSYNILTIHSFYSPLPTLQGAEEYHIVPEPSLELCGCCDKPFDRDSLHAHYFPIGDQSTSDRQQKEMDINHFL